MYISHRAERSPLTNGPSPTQIMGIILKSLVLGFSSLFSIALGFFVGIEVIHGSANAPLMVGTTSTPGECTGLENLGNTSQLTFPSENNYLPVILCALYTYFQAVLLPSLNYGLSSCGRELKVGLEEILNCHRK